MRLYARNKTAINKAREAAKEFDWKPLPHNAPLSAPQINAAVGLDDILVEGDILM
uniref:Aldedh domain-containing protein n=1 Tax=Steinernema glaseri TaxID=37863 RepID=A0A1I8A7L9_9BILA